MFHVTGAYIYVDPQGKPEAVEDVFSKIDLARAHFEKVSRPSARDIRILTLQVGLGANFVDKFIR